MPATPFPRKSRAPYDYWQQLKDYIDEHGTETAGGVQDNLDDEIARATAAESALTTADAATLTTATGRAIAFAIALGG